MVRSRKRKTDRGKTEESLMQRAVELVLKEKQSMRSVAKNLNIKSSTLHRYVQKAQKFGKDNIGYCPNYGNNRVFNDQQEQELVEYLLVASKHHHGLTTKALKDLAFQYAIKNEIKIPESWKQNQRAGEDFLYGFMKRHTELSIIKPEATSLARSVSFNKTNVNMFFDNLEHVMGETGFEPSNIYNCDETGLTTVQSPPNIIAQKNAKQVGQVTSAERGVLVTLCGAVSAAGGFVPPFLIFPRVHFKDHMLQGSPPGSVGVCNPSGWMNAELFVAFLDHFIKFAKCSKTDKVLLMMDNHQSHISIESLEKCKENGIVMLTIPPHTSHKLQPLDRTVYGPLKRYYNDACNSWMMANPGKAITIYEIGSLLGTAFPLAFNPTNITSGFKAAGIFPFNRHIFRDDEFLSSYVTDQPLSEDNSAAGGKPTEERHCEDNSDEASIHMTETNVPSTAEVRPSCSGVEVQTRCSTPAGEKSQENEDFTKHVTPEEIRPFPKLLKRSRNVGRKRAKSLVLTDTPIKKQLEDELRNKKKPSCKKIINKKNNKRKPEQKQACKRAKRNEISSDSESSEKIDACPLTDSDTDTGLNEDEIELELPTKQNVNRGKYVLVKYASKKKIAYFAGQVQNTDVDGGVEVSFLKCLSPRKTEEQLYFLWPEEECKDTDIVELEDIEMLLPQPQSIGGTKRMAKKLVFLGVHLSHYFP